jgi:hypothetical protein
MRITYDIGHQRHTVRAQRAPSNRNGTGEIGPEMLRHIRCSLLSAAQTCENDHVFSTFQLPLAEEPCTKV